ncbi:hypothetical protein Terro_4226 [Terriglobus roseus DSM 18391]|uniref:DUF2252 domain-containing protein n=1 Tax=Terriglobus roseus (strain DSM 18391 / NRRL B-41598 / KBS 63) TaxID=926566 RepID=I3ZMG3_TERRK|nr:DUF2252 family protein [Terriglobus roseus]AFL90431.1 hypothetical protein Terro_4226 [Terriglobus roseus DSM 18391]
MKTAKANIPDRRSTLDQQRHSKMAESAHAYVRGNTKRFYEWLASDAVKASLPSGPDVWICGDCHTGNLGPVADLHGNIDIEIRDVDQTVIGNPAHDLLRLGLSLAMAARSSDLPGVTTALMIEEMIEGYIARLTGHSANITPNEIEPIRRVMRLAGTRQWKHLAEERIEDVTPTIPLGRRYWALEEPERTALENLFQEEKLHRLVEGIRGRTEEQVALLDAAYWMKGCSSLGKLRFAALIGVGKKKHRQFHLLDIKEATAAAAPRALHALVYEDHAERVVTGARALSPFLGDRMIAAQLLGKPVIVRELRPQDMKFELNRLTREDAIRTARLMAGVVGRAHGRQMKPAQRTAWVKELRSRHTRGLDAPRWLWSSILDLAALHEAAYLEHCRLYALGGAAA